MIRVMLIDDHPVVRAGLRAVLNSFGDIEVVAEGTDGAAEVPEGVDVIVTDIQMPNVDGIEVTRRAVAAQAEPPPRKVPVRCSPKLDTRRKGRKRSSKAISPRSRKSAVSPPVTSATTI